MEKLKYDKDQASGKHIEALPLNTDIGYAAYKGRIMVSGRDFLYVSHHAKGPKGEIVLAYQSTEHPEYEPTKKYVRGHTHIAGWFLTPSEDDPNVSNCLYLSQASMKGMLPKVFQDIPAKNQGYKVFVVRDAMKGSKYAKK